jgi:hypothetical protein
MRIHAVFKLAFDRERVTIQIRKIGRAVASPKNTFIATYFKRLLFHKLTNQRARSMNKSLAVAAFTLSSAFNAAYAAPTNPAETFNLGTDPAGYDASVALAYPGAFSDTFEFSLTQPSDAYGAGSYTTQKARFSTIFDISDFTLSLFRSGDGNTLLGSTSAKNFGTLDAFNLDSGNYFYTVSGNVLGKHAGRFDFRVDVLPVPEPETYALMLAGLGLLGAAARRKAKQQG